MGLFRHVQQVFLTREWSSDPAGSGPLRFRPLDQEVDPTTMKFIFWSVLHTQDPAKEAARLTLEMSADGEGWTEHSTVKPRERPYNIPMPYLLPFVRARLDTGGEVVRGYMLLLCTAPFELEAPRLGRVTTLPVPSPKP